MPRVIRGGTITEGAARWFVAVGIALAGAAGMAASYWRTPAPLRAGANATPTVERAGLALPAPAGDNQSGVELPVLPNEPAALTKAEPAKADAARPAPATQPKTPIAPTKTTININTATAAELELLPGIGPALAQRIIDHRREHGAFRRVEDLDDVKGIGPRTLEKLRPLVRVEPLPSP